MSQGPICIQLFNWNTGSPVKKNANGGNEMMYAVTVPSIGFHLSYAGKAWLVKHVILVDKGGVHCMREEVDDLYVAALSEDPSS